MGRQKEVKLHLSSAEAYFLTEGTELVRELPFEQAGMVIKGEGFTIHVNLLKSPKIGTFTADAVVEYTEEIKRWR